MPSERASVTQPSSLPTRHDRDDALGARPGLRLALILIAGFMVVLDFSIVNVALPSIERELAVPTAVSQGEVLGWTSLPVLGTVARRSWPRWPSPPRKPATPSR
jgi:hypothetical protein